MTGYGKATAEFRNKKITVELRSLNSKSMDISTRIPGIYREHELEIRSTVSRRMLRGKADIAITTDEQTADSAPTLNVELMQAYKQRMEQAAATLAIPMPENLMETLLRMPDVLKVANAEPDEQEWEALDRAVAAALDAFDAFRTQEGASLERMFVEKLDTIEQLLGQVEPLERERIDKIRTRLEENLSQISDKIAADPNRLEQEMIYYLEKLDINEEKVRLRNHIRYFRETMAGEAAPGKKLGFIAQEMGREINTLGSKSNHSEMQIIVVKMKDNLEQIKEQVLNVL